MNKLPLALWMLGWWPAMTLFPHVQSATPTEVFGAGCPLWLLGGLILWPWKG